MITTKLIPQRPALLEGFDNEFHVMFCASATEDVPDDVGRKPLNLAVAIDRSGSMDGRPLEEAKKCAISMIKRLAPTDRVAVVIYDSEAEVLVPSTLVSDHQSIEAAIRTIRCGGMTALHDGWLLAAEQVALNQSSDTLNRVLLLSDGNANVGLTDEKAIARQCAGMAEAGITTSTYGLGHHFNEDLMIAMSESGLGQSYYGESVEDLSDSFEEEFALLINTQATQLKLTVSWSEDVSGTLVNQIQVAGTNQWFLPDLAEGGEVWSLFKLNIPAKKLKAAGSLVECRLEYKDKNNSITQSEPCSLELPVLDATAFSAIAENQVVARRLAEVTAGRLQQTAREAARRGDWDRVDDIIKEASVLAKDNDWVLGTIQALKKYARRRQTEQFSKEAMYSARKMNSRLSSQSEMELDFDLNVEAAKPAYLRRKLERGKKMN